MAILYSGTEGTCQWTIDDQGHLYIGDGIISHNTYTASDWGWFAYREEIISVSSGNVSWATGANASNMFASLRNATSIDVSNFNTQNVRAISYMFYDCEKLTSLDLSNFNTSNVTNMSYLFSYCFALLSLDISNFNTQRVITMEGMFEGCSALKSLNLFSFNTMRLENTNYMFRNCGSLKTIFVSDFWSIAQINQDIQMFMNCSALIGGQNTVYNSSYTGKNYAHVDGGTSNPGYLTHINNAPACYASFNSDTGELRIFRDVSGLYTNAQVIGNTTYWTGIEDITGNTTPRWFSKKTFILSINIVNTFKPKTAFQMFYGCDKITSLNLLNLNTSNVSTMAYMFTRCSSLTSLDLSNFNTDNVTNMTNMFESCYALTSVNLSSFDIKKVTNMQYMFSRCSNLRYLELYVNGITIAEFEKILDIFGDTPSDKEYYIINKGSADATFWRSVADAYEGVHYEVNDFAVTISSPTIQHRSLNNNITKLVSPTVNISFDYQINNLIPHSWSYTISKIACQFSGDNSDFLIDTNPLTHITNQHYSYNSNALTNKDTAILKLYATITVGNTVKESNKLVGNKMASVSMANLPILTYNYIDTNNKFLYQINGSTNTVGIYAYDETYAYSNIDIPITVTFDNKTYTVTKLNVNAYNPTGTAIKYGCFETNNLITNVNSIPVNITDMDRFMYGCSNLTTHNIIFKSTAVSSFANAFTGTSANIKIFLIDDTTPPTNTNTAASTVANAFNNVYYNATNNGVPDFNVIDTGNRYAIKDGAFVQKDDDGPWAKFTIDIAQVQNNAIPVGWTSNSFINVSAKVNNVDTDIKKSVNTNLTASDLNNTATPIEIYINVGVATSTVVITATDYYNHSQLKTLRISQLFAMLDFMNGGRGMAIGKIAERNGLDVSIPTTIGIGLLPPTTTVDNTETIDMTNYQLVIGKYNVQKPTALLVIGAGLDDSNRRNVLELDEAGLRVYATDGTTQLANIGYGEGQAKSGTAVAPYYTLGVRNTAGAQIKGNYSVAAGYIVEASGFASHAEGSATIANAPYSHAEGTSTIASGSCSHAEGDATRASGFAAHAEGYSCQAGGDHSHAQNLGTIANGIDQTAIGRYNANSSTNAFEIGNGSSNSARSNALTIDWNGQITRGDGALYTAVQITRW